MWEFEGNGDSSLGSLAMHILGSVVEETPWNREALNSWREVANQENVNRLYNTCEYDEGN